MNRIMMVLGLSLACVPGVALAQDSDAPAPADTTPPPSADCTTLDCNTSRQQQDNLNNDSGTPGAQDSLGDDRGATGGSGTLPPTIPDRSLGGNDNDSGLDGSKSNGLSGSGSLNGGSSGGGLSD